MKNTIFVASLCAVSLFSCKKTEIDPVTVVAPIDSQAYMLTNVQDITFLNNTSFAWEIPVEYKTGKTEKVTVAIAGLPANVKTSIDSVSGLPSFTPVFNLTAKYATPGVYPINIYATSASLGTRKYDVNLTVKPAADCYLDFTGSYPNTSSTRNDTTFKTYMASISYNSAYTVNLSCNCKVYYANVKANLDCDKGTLTIPQQKASGTDNLISGTGELLADGTTVVLKYSYYDDFMHNWKNYVDTLK